MIEVNKHSEQIGEKWIILRDEEQTGPVQGVWFRGNCLHTESPVSILEIVFQE